MELPFGDGWGLKTVARLPLMGPLVNDPTAIAKRDGRNLSFSWNGRDVGVGFVGREDGREKVAGLEGRGSERERHLGLSQLGFEVWGMRRMFRLVKYRSQIQCF